MKKNLIALTCIMAWGIFGYSQERTSGIYLTQEDFENRKLSYSNTDDNQDNKIRFNEFIEKPFINIRHKGEKIIVFKDDIYAYQKKGNIVRTHNFKTYNFIERGIIWIYYKDVTIPLGKGIKRERQYFYSVSGRDNIMPLTIMNLKKSFPEKFAFHNMLDAQFRKDSDLIAYNRLEKKFQVNHLLETTAFVTGDAIP
jgi:hypothetical protein